MPDQAREQSSFTTIREATYRGKSIRVETTYKITIDGEPVTAHVQVLDDGVVHCHSFPNYSFPSAVDLAHPMTPCSISITATSTAFEKLGWQITFDIKSDVP